MLKSYFTNNLIEAGCDEAGRGCLVGSVFAAAVILPKDFYHEALNDSKKVNLKNRILLKKFIENHAISFAVASVSAVEIDQINILNASIKAMHLAITKLDKKPELLLIDGNRFSPFWGIPHHCIVKGDNKYMSIAAASILAKTYRDEYMQKLDLKYPQYGWKKNKGYATVAHRAALNSCGPSPYQRKSFILKESKFQK